MPSIKQKRAFDNSLENNGNITKAMRDAGYSEATLNNPKDLTESDGYKELEKNYADSIPDKLVKEKHKALLNRVDDKGDVDVQAVKAGLDMAYKIKGAYKINDVNVQVNIANLIEKYNDD